MVRRRRQGSEQNFSAQARATPSPPHIANRDAAKTASWRGFSARLYAEPGVDGIRSLHALFKVALGALG
jgi:hypothetical protein